MEQMENKKIDDRFKIIYAFAIMMVVLDHALGANIRILGEWFPYSGYHLPLFIFSSGYFFYEQESFMRYFFYKIKKLIIPLLIWNLIYGLIIQILHKYGFIFGGNLNFYTLVILPFNFGHAFVLNLGTWFLAPLFMVQILMMFLCKVIPINSKYKLGIITIIALLGG